MTPADDEVGLYEDVAGFVRPEATVSAHLDLAGAARRRPPVRGAGHGVGGRRRRRPGDHRGGHATPPGSLVICPGAWAPELLADLALPLTVERQVMYWFQPDGGVGPFTPDRQPVWIHGGDGPPALRLPGHRRSRRRGQGGVLPARRGLHAGDDRPRGAPGGGRRSSPRTCGRCCRRCRAGSLTRRRVHVHDDAGPALRRRDPSAARAGDRGLRLLRPRLQVRAGDRGDPGRPRAHRDDGPSDRPVRPAPSGDDFGGRRTVVT